jgi:hypothetical protein
MKAGHHAIQDHVDARAFSVAHHTSTGSEERFDVRPEDICSNGVLEDRGECPTMF